MWLSRKWVTNLLVIGICWFGFVSPAASAPISYGDYTGTHLSFLNVTEDSTTTNDPLFGAPNIIAEQYLFFPTTFTSTSTGAGAYDITSGELTMTLRAADGFAISSVNVTELGNYSLTGSGTASTWADISAMLDVGSQSASLLFDPAGPYALPGDSSDYYNGSTTLDFSGLRITELSFKLTNVLETQSEAGTTAFITKNYVGGGVGLEINTTPIPIPGAVWLLVSGLITLWGVRLRFTKQNNLTD